MHGSLRIDGNNRRCERLRAGYMHGLGNVFTYLKLKEGLQSVM